jgi:hypothetical protein
MRINEENINYNAVSMIKDLTESRYDMIMEATAEKRGYLLMTIGEIAGIIEMANAMKEVLKS